MALFVEENLNPKKKKTNDCVIRALAKAENKSWLEVFDTLTDIARKKYSVINDSTVVAEYLKYYEKVNVMHEVNGQIKRYTVAEVAGMEGSFIISIANHITVVIDKKIYDIWDCRDRSTYKIWKIK